MIYHMKTKAAFKKFYGKTANRRESFRKSNWYYHQDLLKYYRFLIPEGKQVLEIGSGTGYLLSSLKPRRGVGIDISREMVDIAKKKYSKISFIVMDAEKIKLKEKFDFIVISGTIGDLDDIQSFFSRLHQLSHDRTRIIIDHYNHLWQPFLRLAEKLGVKTPQIYQNWLPTEEIINLLELSNFEVIKTHQRMLFPLYIPFISELINGFIAKLPIIRTFCLNRFLVARPVGKTDPEKKYSCSVVVPARNEKGTIEDLVVRTPQMGVSTEIIFVEGHSIDGTRAEIERVIKKYPGKKISLIKQNRGKGKADAVHLGFQAAKGEILLILDADLSVSPEDAPKFYKALANGKGEFVNGSRLIYPMEKRSMQFLNLIGNYFFGMMFTWLLEEHITDTLCGTKAIWKKDYLILRKLKKYFGDFDPFGDYELLFGASKMNLKYTEVPVRYKARVYGQTNIQRWRHVVLLLRMCWIAFWRLKVV